MNTYVNHDLYLVPQITYIINSLSLIRIIIWVNYISEAMFKLGKY